MYRRSTPSFACAVLLCLASTLPISAAGRSEMQIRYSLTPTIQGTEMMLHVVVDLQSLPHKETVLVLPSSWGNATRLQGAIRNLKSESSAARIDDGSDSATKVLRGYSGRRARISYDLVKDWQGPLRESVRHRPHLDPAYVEINGNNGLVRPELDAAAPVDCTFEWNLPTDWTVATSFGVQERRQRHRGPWDSIENALFVAGDFRIRRVPMGKGTLVVAIRGTWAMPEDDAVSQIVRVIRMERSFWKDEAFPYFLVTLVPFGPGQSGSGGSGFTNAFNLHTAPETRFSQELLSLLAHEVFHTWNPYKLGRMRSPEEGVYWFTEVFTMYYQDVLLRRAGLMPFADYVEAVNRRLRDYHRSSDRNISLQDLIRRAKRNPDKSRISYERGAAIALWLDAAIRRDSAGKASLDTLMFDLFQEANRNRRGFPDLTSERVLGAASPYLSATNRQLLRTYVEEGTTVEAPSDALGECVAAKLVDMPSFDLGMDRTALVEKRTVSGLVPGSAAQKAGLVEGDAIVGMSIHWDDTTKPIKLVVRRGDKRSTFNYHPHGPSVGTVPQYFLDKDRFEREPQSCGNPGKS